MQMNISTRLLTDIYPVFLINLIMCFSVTNLPPFFGVSEKLVKLKPN